MYPFVRMLLTGWKAKKQPPISFLDVHVSQHRCWPHDLDIFLEMNNGRVLTILDMGRLGLAVRSGLNALVTRKRWGVAVAGGSTRYRKRIRAFAKFEMRTRCVGWDARFVYMEQSIWIGQDCAAQALLRTCVTDKNGIVPTDKIIKEMGTEIEAPALPDWVQAWIDAEAVRPWPPERPAA